VGAKHALVNAEESGVVFVLLSVLDAYDRSLSERVLQGLQQGRTVEPKNRSIGYNNWSGLKAASGQYPAGIGKEAFPYEYWITAIRKIHIQRFQVFNPFASSSIRI
jgi:hypothetical protein